MLGTIRDAGSRRGDTEGDVVLGHDLLGVLVPGGDPLQRLGLVTARMSMSRLHGQLPYRDLVMLHPPGVVLALAPFAAIAGPFGDPVALVLGKVVVMLAGGVTAALVAWLVRDRGTVAMWAAGGTYAVFVPAAYADSSLTLEAVSNLLLAAALALSVGVGRPQVWQLWSAGALLGVATATKIWGVCRCWSLGRSCGTATGGPSGARSRRTPRHLTSTRGAPGARLHDDQTAVPGSPTTDRRPGPRTTTPDRGDTYCIDVLQQIAAVNGALQNVAIGLLDEHVGQCVANAATAGDQNKARDMVTEATQPSPGLSRPDARPTHGIRNSRRTPVGTPGAAVMDRSCGAGGRATVREPVSYTHLTLPTN